MNVVIPTKKLTAWLIRGMVLLVLAYVVTQSTKYLAGYPRQLGFVRLFDLDAENNAPTWFSSLLLLLASVLLAIIGVFRRQTRERDAFYWLGLAAIFLCLSLDEAASIHELAVSPMRNLLNADGLLYYTWVVPGAAVILLLGLIYLRFLKSLPARTRNLFVIAALLFVSGALGAEMLGGYVYSRQGGRTPTYAAIVLIEETMEMLGVIVFIHALTLYLSAHIPAVHVRFVGENPIPPRGPASPAGGIGV